MEITTTSRAAAGYPHGVASTNEASSAGVSWSAVLAGAAVTAALALVLLALGTGLGMSSVSLWSNQGASASAITTAAILWLIFMQIVSSSMGGYLSGRLRTKWVSIHTDEVYFRDTAHGFLSWAVALVATAAFLAAAATSLMGSAPSAPAGRGVGPNDYFVDQLFRSNGPKADGENGAVRSEAGTIMANALKQGDLSSPDQAYLVQLVTGKTGLNSNDADKRVIDTFANAKQAAETARKALAHSLLWSFAALLIGAFCASFAATLGGRQRDHVATV